MTEKSNPTMMNRVVDTVRRFDAALPYRVEEGMAPVVRIKALLENRFLGKTTEKPLTADLYRLTDGLIRVLFTSAPEHRLAKISQIRHYYDSIIAPAIIDHKENKAGKLSDSDEQTLTREATMPACFAELLDFAERVATRQDGKIKKINEKIRNNPAEREKHQKNLEQSLQKIMAQEAAKLLNEKLASGDDSAIGGNLIIPPIDFSRAIYDLQAANAPQYKIKELMAAREIAQKDFEKAQKDSVAINVFKEIDRKNMRSIYAFEGKYDNSALITSVTDLVAREANQLSEAGVSIAVVDTYTPQKEDRQLLTASLQQYRSRETVTVTLYKHGPEDEDQSGVQRYSIVIANRGEFKAQ